MGTRLRGKETLVFADPPYTTSFSSYDGNPLTSSDHEELAEIPAKSKSKVFLIVNKESKSLYSRLPYRAYTLEDTYSYSVKGRNDRKARHRTVTRLHESLLNTKILASYIWN